MYCTGYIFFILLALQKCQYVKVIHKFARHEWQECVLNIGERIERERWRIMNGVRVSAPGKNTSIQQATRSKVERNVIYP